MSTSSFNGSLYPQNQRKNNVFAFSKVRRLDFWRVMFFIKAPLSFGRRKKHSWLDTSPRIPGRCKKTVMVPVISNGEMIGLSSFHCSNSFCHGKIPNIPKESWRVFFLHTSSWQHHTYHTPQKQKKNKKGACFPSPPKLGRTSTPSIFPLAVLPPCHSYLAAGSRLRWNAARQWCAWSRWDPGTWETDPAPGCAVRMRRWWEMCRLVFFFLNSIDQTMSVQWNLPLVASSPLAASPTSSCKVFHHTICILTSPFVSSFAARTRSSMKRL